MIEEEPGKLCIGLRSKTGLDISIFAKKLGGGGHLYRAGATVYGKDFEKVIALIRNTYCKYEKAFEGRPRGPAGL